MVSLQGRFKRIRFRINAGVVGASFHARINPDCRAGKQQLEFAAGEG
jgi:hypothetical protein